MSPGPNVCCARLLREAAPGRRSACNGLFDTSPIMVTLGYSQDITMTLSISRIRFAVAATIGNRHTRRISGIKTIAICGIVLAAATLNSGARYCAIVDRAIGSCEWCIASRSRSCWPRASHPRQFFQSRLGQRDPLVEPQEEGRRSELDEYDRNHHLHLDSLQMIHGQRRSVHRGHGYKYGVLSHHRADGMVHADRSSVR